MFSTHQTALSRRNLLLGLGAAAAAGGLGATAGCSRNGSSTGSNVTASAVDKSIIPVTVPLTNIPKPDLQGTSVVPNYYFSYPSDHPKTVNHAMGSGDALSAFILTYSAPPKAKADNKYWQFINEKLGVDFQPNLVPADTYQTKFAALTASGNLPDVTQVVNYMPPARMDTLVSTAFEDLTDLLKGENVKKWPNIAALPQTAWTTAMLNGKIWGVPVIPQPYTSGLWVRDDLTQAKGIKELPKTKDDFLSFCQEMTGDGKYALGGWAGGSPVWIPNTTWGMFKVPNRFRLDGDKLVKQQETDEYMQAIDFTKQLWDKKYFHPDSPTLAMDKNIAAFWQGTIIARENGFGDYSSQAQHTEGTMAFRVPYAADGGQGVHFSGTAFSVSAIKKGSTKVEEILNVIDWLNAPFGSQEHFENRFGPEGVTYEMKNGQPTTISGSENLTAINTIFVGAGSDVMYTTDPKLKSFYQGLYDAQKAMEPMLVSDPTVGYYAPSNSKSAALDKTIDDAQGDYIMGRKTLDEFKQVIADWRKNGGDQICKEYEQAMAAAK